MIDSKVLKVMDLAIKYIGKLSEEDLDKLIGGSGYFSISDKEKSIKKNMDMGKVNNEIDWSIEVDRIKESKDRDEAYDYVRKLKLTNEKLRSLGEALGISITKSTKKDKIIAMIIEYGIGNRLKSEGIRKGIIGNKVN